MAITEHHDDRSGGTWKSISIVLWLARRSSLLLPDVRQKIVRRTQHILEKLVRRVKLNRFVDVHFARLQEVMQCLSCLLQPLVIGSESYHEVPSFALARGKHPSKLLPSGVS